MVRIGTWNCRQRLDDKLGFVDELACDVLVVPEAAEDNALSTQLGVSLEWFGDIRSKGVGIFAFNGWTIRRRDEPSLPWCLPLEVSHEHVDRPLVLLAVWTVNRPGDGNPPYATQVEMVIDRWHDTIRDDDVLIAGDLNTSFQTAKPAGHAHNVERLASLGCVSAYHHANDVAPGEETDMTLRWIGPGRIPHHFHCDYIFVSHSLAGHLSGARIGTMTDWVDSGRSDHCPVTAELSLRNG